MIYSVQRFPPQGKVVSQSLYRNASDEVMKWLSETLLQQMSLLQQQQEACACELKVLVGGGGLWQTPTVQQVDQTSELQHDMQLAAGHGAWCWVILRVGVINWELNAFLKCLGGCLKGMSSYGTAWGAENTCSDQSTLPHTTSATTTTWKKQLDLCNEQLINPFRLSPHLSWPHRAALSSEEHQHILLTASTLTTSEWADWKEAFQPIPATLTLNVAESQSQGFSLSSC